MKNHIIFGTCGKDLAITDGGGPYERAIRVGEWTERQVLLCNWTQTSLCMVHDSHTLSQMAV